MSTAAIPEPTPSTKRNAMPNVIIRASAGTGKTFQLSNRYLKQLLTGAQPDEILATTFTRKAAGEILERNMIRLAEASLDADRCRELAGFLEMPDLSCEQCLKLLQRLTRGLHRVRICTLDSFFSQITSSFGFEMGLPPDWSIVDEIEQVRLKNKAVEEVLRNETTNDAIKLMHLLTKGETDRTVSELIRQTVDSLYPIFQETNITAWSDFPRASLLAGDALQAAIEELREAWLPDDKRFRNARDSDLENAETLDWDTFVQKGLAKRIAAGETTYYKKEIGESAIKAYKILLRHARAVLIDLVAKQTEATYQLLSRFDLRYSQLKDDARVLQFDDITRLLADIAASNDVDSLSYRMDGKIAHLLLDEFQDTSLAQWQVIRPFAKHVTGRSKSRSFFCVGDGKQAIYGWRGGVAEIFDAIENELSGLTRETLNRSFRSAPAIVQTTNNIFNGLKNLTDDDDDTRNIRQWCDQFIEHSTARTELGGYACLETAPLTEERTEQFDATMRHAAERIAEMSRKVPQATIGVLSRKNKVVSRLIFELRRLGIAASEEGGNPLADSAAVQLVMSLLKMADHPGNTAARYHVAQSPLGRFLKFTQHNNHDRAEAVAREVRGRLQSEGYGKVLQEWAELLSPLCGPRGRRRLAQMVELSYAWQSHATLRTADFLRFLQLKKVPDPTVDKVRVMTVHQSKGLEFDIVVLPDLDGKLIGQPDEFVVNKPSPTEPIDRVCRYRNASIQELLPAKFQKMFDDVRRTELSEALCVLYVAVTRARHALHMVVAPSRKSEKTMPKTTTGLLRRTLTNGAHAEPQRILYEFGESNWYTKEFGDSATTPIQEPSEKDGVPASTDGRRIRFRAMPEGRSRGLQRKAPSRHDASRKVKLTSVIRHGSSAAMERGTLIHAWFELIEWLDEAAWPEDEQLRAKADEIGAGNLDVSKLIGEFHAMLRSPKIAWGLTRKSYVPPKGLPLPSELLQRLDQAEPSQIRLEVHNEHSFAVREGGEIVSGFIDRLVLIFLDNQLVACDVIDFKTDTFAFDDTKAFAAKIEFYQEQLDSYRRVVARLYRLPVSHVSTRLFMVGAGTITNV